MEANLFSKSNKQYFSGILSILLILITLLLSIAAVSAADNLEVNPDGGVDNTDISTPFETIQGAIDQAQAGDNITLIGGSGTFNGTSNRGIVLNLSKNNLIFIGKNGATIDAEGADVIFTVESGVTVTFINITFTRGHGGQGGAIHNGNGIVLVNGCTFENNNVDYDNSGGAIWNNGVMHIDNCTFSDNHAGVSAGAFYSGIGDNIIIENSIFRDNTARHGGAIDVVNGTNVKIINCTFEGNEATASSGNWGGGAIRIHGPESDGTIGCYDFQIINCNFTDNYSNMWGGAISNYGVRTIVENCNFTINEAVSNGGAIYNNGSNMSVINSKFDNNEANKGGGIFNDHSMLVSGNTMSGNIAKDVGMMIYNNGNMGILNLTFIGNVSIEVKNGDVVMLNATLTDDMGNNVTWQNVNFTVNGVLVDDVNCIEGLITGIPYTVSGSPGDRFVVTGEYAGNDSYADYVVYGITIKNGLLYIPGSEPPVPPRPEPPKPEPPEPEPPEPVPPSSDDDTDDDTDNTDGTINTPKVKASMKKTGMPVIAIMLLILSIVGASVYRKQ